jgi:outer membrane protein assembly factor BamB
MPTDIETLKKIIAEKVFVLNKDEQIGGLTEPDAWLFDFRRILMNGRAANLISDIFYEQFKDSYPFQLGALEIAGVPLVTSLMTKFYYKGTEDINAFFIRKSRKKTGLMRMIEGTLQSEKKIILVDDILNSGNSFWRQVEILEQLHYKVDTIWCILRFREEGYYTRFTERGIKIKSLFTLDDFTITLGERVRMISDKPAVPVPMPFNPLWQFKSPKPSFGHVVTKSQPTLDETKVYFGSDNRIFWALNQTDGSVAWKYTVGLPNNGKSIFSNPAIHKNLIIFGAYDGNVYALDKETGKRVWVSMEADWVGSSPTVAADLNLVFIGLEFGLFRKRGGIAALNIDTGKTVWMDNTHPALTHGTPCYIKKTHEVAIGSNDGKVRMYNAKNGTLLWEFTTEGGATYDLETSPGFSEGDIKEALVYSERHDYIIFGSVDTYLYILERKSGKLVQKYACEFGIYSSPYIHNNKVYFTSADKTLGCVNLDTLQLIFKKNLDGTRIFSSPTVINNRLYVGTNAGRLHELDLENASPTGYFQALERITNTVIQNPKTGIYFVPTYANEIIALERP